MDGGFQYFLLLMFVFWILEGIAKNKQRRRAEEAAGEEEETGAVQRAPTPLESEAETRTPAQRIPPGDATEPRGRPPRRAPSASAPPQRAPTASAPPKRAPRTLWEEIAELARQQQEQQRPQPLPPEGRGEARGPESDREYERAAARRIEAPPADVPRHSDRWATGKRRETEVTPAQDVQPAPATQPAPSAVPTVRRDIVRAPLRTALERSPVRAPGVGLGEGRRLADAARTPHTKAILDALNPTMLPRLSRAELRRLLVLREVLSPPLALREEPTGE
jgi:hypothetical protein